MRESRKVLQRDGIWAVFQSKNRHSPGKRGKYTPGRGNSVYNNVGLEWKGYETKDLMWLECDDDRLKVSLGRPGPHARSS